MICSLEMWEASGKVRDDEGNEDNDIAFPIVVTSTCG